MQPDANGPKAADRLEVQRRVSGIMLKQLIRLVRQRLSVLGQRAVGGPE